MAQETQTVALYHLEVWDEEGDGREVQKVCVWGYLYNYRWDLTENYKIL